MRCAAFLVLAATTLVPAADAAGAELAGASTTISPSLCAPTDAQTLRCAGYGGLEVRLFGPEDARTLALGGTEPAFPPLPVAGRLGRSVDWRLDADGAPLTGAVRWQAAEGSAELVLLLRPARDGAAGCLQLVTTPTVELDGLSQRRFRCGVDRPALVGPIPPRLRTALEPWLAAVRP